MPCVSREGRKGRTRGGIKEEQGNPQISFFQVGPTWNYSSISRNSSRQRAYLKQPGIRVGSGEKQKQCPVPIPSFFVCSSLSLEGSRVTDSRFNQQGRLACKWSPISLPIVPLLSGSYSCTCPPLPWWSLSLRGDILGAQFTSRDHSKDTCTLIWDKDKESNEGTQWQLKDSCGPQFECLWWFHHVSGECSMWLTQHQSLRPFKHEWLWWLHQSLIMSCSCSLQL